MNPVRKRKLLLIVSLLLVLTCVTCLVLFALRQNINLFYTPTQIANGEGGGNQQIRLGGVVVKGSVHRQANLEVQFRLTDFKQTILVNYRGILPDLFREGQGVVASGTVQRSANAYDFKAQEVLAKHDANYMPPQLKQTLMETTAIRKTL